MKHPRCSIKLLVALAAASALHAAPPVQYSPDAIPVGSLPSAIPESSGLAPSHRAPGLYWTHNDKGNPPQLFAIAEDGTLRGTVRIEGAPNTDWEDLASFQHNGRSWLVIADVGDNQSVRQDCRLHFVLEPAPESLRPDQELTLPVAYSLPVRYPDGPRDCEAVAIDAPAGHIYLISKRTRPAVVYRLPLHSENPDAYPPAERVATLDLLETAVPGKPWTLPTAMDITSDGRTAAVLTYDLVMIYRRPAKATWAEVFARSPSATLRVSVDTPTGASWTSAEAVAFTPDASAVLLTTEGKSTPLLKLPVR